MKKKWISIILSLSMFILVACDGSPAEDMSATRQIFAMDTYMTLTAYGREAEEAVLAAVREVNRLDAMLSTGRETSEVAKLNQNGKGEMSADVKALYESARECYEETSGAFDITIYPLMKAWGFADENYRVPEDRELRALLPLVDGSKLVTEENTLILPEGVAVDFGGIAKGYTSDCLEKVFAKYELNGAIVSLGGNVDCYGAKKEGEQWSVGIENPSASPIEGDYIGILSLNDRAVITSGGYERFFEKEGKKYHHILNPKTGKPADTGLVSVTRVSKNGTKADALSTALYVMGRERGEAFWREHREEFDVVWLETDGSIGITAGLKNCFQSDHPYSVLQ